MDESYPKISVSYTDGATIATLTDERILDDVDIRALEASVIPLLEQTTGIKLVLDFSAVKFLSSAVLGLLVKISKKVYESQGQLKLCGISPPILKIFKITRLDKIFDIYENKAEAAASLD